MATLGEGQREWGLGHMQWGCGGLHGVSALSGGKRRVAKPMTDVQTHEGEPAEPITVPGRELAAVPPSDGGMDVQQPFPLASAQATPSACPCLLPLSALIFSLPLCAPLCLAGIVSFTGGLACANVWAGPQGSL